MNRMMFAAVLGLALLLQIGCSPSGFGQAYVEYCQAVDHYRDTTAVAQDITEETTVDELDELRGSISAARQDLLESATSLHEARLRYAESAWEDWEKQVKNVSGDTTIGEAAPFLRGQIDVLITEIDRVNNISCERR